MVGPAVSRQEKQLYGHGQYPQIKQATCFSSINLADNLAVH